MLRRQCNRTYYKPYNLVSRQQQWLRKKQSKASLMSRPSSSNEASCWIDTAVSVQEQNEGDINVSDFEGSMLANPGNDCSDNDHVISLMNNFNLDSTSSETFVIANPVQNLDPINKVVGKLTVTQIIRNWALAEINVPKASVSKLLSQLYTVHDELPKSFKTLLTKQKLLYKPMQEGLYCHFPDWTSSLKKLLTHMQKLSCNADDMNYYLLVNIDGLPLFNHSPDLKLYPILVSIYH